MNYAIVIAGGTGTRMKSDLPKQFIKVKDRPILVYTLESFQNYEYIDCIEVVCIEGWEKEVESYIKDYNLSKVQYIVKAGKTVQESIRNGVFNLEGKCSNDDIVIIHDGIRPIVDNHVLKDVIDKCKQYGNAVTSLPYNEQIFLKNDDISTTQYIPRDTLRRVSTPQAYRFDLLDEKYHEAFNKKIGIYGSSYTNTMMIDLGVKLYFAEGSDKNIKLTTPDDLAIFEAMLNKNA